MDMIYADANFTDLGVLQDYSFDECYGDEDNTFQCKVQKYNHVCREDYFLYMESTEYGGIIDRIESDTKSGEITYIGRTWHGILNSYVIKPPRGNVYQIYNGEANNVIRQIISDIGITGLFEVSTENSGIYISNYTVRYEKAYDVIREMLKHYQGKFYAQYNRGKIYIGAVYAVNYATNEEFDTSQVPFKVGKTYNNVNHLICLGEGEAEDRAVIHLFTSDHDEDGDEIKDIQPYIKVDPVPHPTGNPVANHWYQKNGNLYFLTRDTSVVSGKTYYAERIPKQDSDYVLDESQKVMSGRDEITEIYEVSNAGIITNYLPKENRPDDWKTSYYLKYYEQTGEDRYSLFKQTYKDEFKLIDSPTPPSGWDEKTMSYLNYYMWDSTANQQYYYKDPFTGYWIECDAEEADERQAEGYEVDRKTGAFVSVRTLTEDEHPERLDYQLADVNGGAPWDWNIDNYTNFYEITGTNPNTYQKVSEQTEPWYGNGVKEDVSLQAVPFNWGWAWNSYYTRRKNALDKWEYYAIEGIHHSHYQKISNDKAPAEWTTNWGGYYYLSKVPTPVNVGGKEVIILTSVFITLQDAVNQKLVKLKRKKSYPAYKKNAFYVLVQDKDEAPNFNTIKNASGVFVQNTRRILPAYEPNRYYRMKFNSTPDWGTYNPPTFYGYWQKVGEQEQIPIFTRGKVYYAVEDRYKLLAEAGVNRLLELNDNDTLDINLELEQKYDVGDVVGSMDETTGIGVNRTILRKIIKIKKDIITVEYEVNNYE